MTNISTEGRNKVREAYEQAKEYEAKVANEYKVAVKRSEALLIALHCPHNSEDLVDNSMDGMMMTRCRRCGFVWEE